jgi:hypothetical protein
MLKHHALQYDLRLLLSLVVVGPTLPFDICMFPIQMHTEPFAEFTKDFSNTGVIRCAVQAQPEASS